MKDRVYCTLCLDQKVEVNGVYVCTHCDTTKGCKGARCGACEAGRQRVYPGLPEAPS